MEEEENEEIQEISEEQEEGKEEIKTTKFQSPVPILRKVRNLIFGKRVPDIYTRITFYMNSVIWTTFMIWNIISYFTLQSRHLIWQQKGIPIEQIIQRRGSELGFTGDDFISRLLTFHAVSIICWAVVFFGLILLYRKSRRFIYFVLGGLIFYIGMSIFYISFTYFVEDTTAYDKIALLVIIVSSLLHAYLMQNERSGGSIGFFGEPTDPTPSEEEE
jgi:hypothetical protein